MGRSVVVTGVGAITPLGDNASTTWSALLAGTSGMRTLEWANDLPVTFAGVIQSDLIELGIEKAKARKLDRSQQFAVLTAREAWADAGLSEVDQTRLGVCYATGIGGVTSLLEQSEVLRNEGPRFVSPMTVPMLMPNGPAAWIGLEFKAQAGVHTPVSACASGAEAVAWGARMIQDNRADVVIVGGTEAAITRLTISAFASMRALSKRNDDPTHASR
ncbi:MAG: beta-ketoacyl-[acyl-carrier-protein] synthase family protein, partial [Candidatus Nanopelagicales bacterium]